MALLRGPGGCPWDAEQTHDSIRRNFLEETYETLDALDRDDAAGMCEELGDVLMQVAFHAQIEAERERKLRESTYDEELRMREEEKEEKRNSVEKINFFQRVVPLQSMIKRAIKHGDAIMWGRP